MQLGILFEYWLVTIAALFVIVNPLTTAFVFLSMLPRASVQTPIAIARRAILVASGFSLSSPCWEGLSFNYSGLHSKRFG